MAEAEQIRQPGLVVSVRQPEKMYLMAWPTFPQVRGWLQHVRQAWRVLTSVGDHAERYLERAIEAARKPKTEEEFESMVEAMVCDCRDYLTAEEKMALELAAKMPDNLQRDLSVLREWRRKEGLPATQGRTSVISMGSQKALQGRGKR